LLLRGFWRNYELRGGDEYGIMGATKTAAHSNRQHNKTETKERES